MAQDTRERVLKAEGNFLIWLLLVLAELDGNFPIEPFEEVQQLVGSEAVEMSIHQARHLRPLDAEKLGDLPLREPPIGVQLKDMKSQLRPS